MYNASGLIIKGQKFLLGAFYSINYSVARHLVRQRFNSGKSDNSLNFIDKSKEIMLIERTNNEVIIRLPASVDTTGLQRLVDYLTYKEATANSKATQEQHKSK